jgi:ferredoxin-nitrate reductase
LWIAGTSPAVSLPELSRIRKILGKEALFLMVSDGNLTETTAFADVVLPAAPWGEKTGTYTNTDRTVHLSERAVAPPGEARSDLDIWLDYARGDPMAVQRCRPERHRSASCRSPLHDR